MLFEARVDRLEGWDVVAVVGDVDLASLPRLNAVLDSVAGERVAVDLRPVEWFDPVCTGALVATATRCRRRNARLVVLAHGATAEMLAETGLDGVLEVAGQLP